MRQISVSDFELLEDADDLRSFQRIIPVYRGTERNSSKAIRNYIEQVLQQEIAGLDEFLPEEQIGQYHLLGYWGSGSANPFSR